MGLALILPVFTAILKNTCLGLKELTLRMDDDLSQNLDWAWDNDVVNSARKTDDQRTDELVEKVVLDLESLEILNLDGDKSFKALFGKDLEYTDHWEKSYGVISAL